MNPYFDAPFLLASPHLRETWLVWAPSQSLDDLIAWLRGRSIRGGEALVIQPITYGRGRWPGGMLPPPLEKYRLQVGTIVVFTPNDDMASLRTPGASPHVLSRLVYASDVTEDADRFTVSLDTSWLTARIHTFVHTEEAIKSPDTVISKG